MSYSIGDSFTRSMLIIEFSQFSAERLAALNRFNRYVLIHNFTNLVATQCYTNIKLIALNL